MFQCYAVLQDTSVSVIDCINQLFEKCLQILFLQLYYLLCACRARQPNKCANPNCCSPIVNERNERMSSSGSHQELEAHAERSRHISQTRRLSRRPVRRRSLMDDPQLADPVPADPDQPDLLEEEAEVKQEDEKSPPPAPDEDVEEVGEEAGDRVGDEDEGEEDDDDDDDEDDVQINIGDYKPGSLSLTPGPININMKKGPSAGAAKTKVVAVDLNAEGTVNGESIYDFNVDTIEEKPWTKPGADITDYFNYGFTEENWKLYCLKQRKLRQEVADEGMPHQSSGPSNQKPGRDYNNRSVDSIVNENSKYSGQQLKALGAGPPPGRKPCGSIDVIGTQSGGIPSRRPMDQNDFDANPNKIQVLSRPPPLGPPPPFNMSMPPPHLMHGMDGGYIPRMPPPGMMPPNGQSLPFHPEFHSGPPPRFMPPPPNQMMGEAPRGGYNEEYDDGPDDRERDYGFMRGGSHRGSRGGYDRGGYRGDEGDFRRGPPPPAHPYDRREMDQREFEIRDYADQMDRTGGPMIRSDREERSESRDAHEGSSSRSRSHRDRDRDHDSKPRDKDKEGDREKDRSESSSSKRRHHDDDKSSSSRHKHSKRSRRDKDEESSSSKH